MEPASYVVEAIERVLLLDLPDEVTADAVKAHAALFAGVGHDDHRVSHLMYLPPLHPPIVD
jgi:hypothetical protein